MTGASFATWIPADKSNYTAGRPCDPDTISIHHMGGINSAKGCGEMFATPGYGASASYSIGNSGDTAQHVSEADTSWANSDWTANCRAITIEVSNAEVGGEWRVSDEAYRSLIRLVADIARRNGIKLVPGKTLTWHSMYAATICPGDYLRARMDDIAERANKIVESSTPADWSKDAVEWATSQRILTGDEMGDLHLRDACTREELVTILKRAMG